ncbi:MAG: permease prefix domain 1-containing protein [Acidobacteriota bacterium]
MVRARLAGCGLRPTTEMDVIEELTQHVEDRYQQLCADGVTEDEARARSLCEIDGEDFLADLLSVLPREQL